MHSLDNGAQFQPLTFSKKINLKLFFLNIDTKWTNFDLCDLHVELLRQVQSLQCPYMYDKVRVYLFLRVIM